MLRADADNKLPPDLQYIPEHRLRRMAHILGEQSAAHKALGEIEALRKHGVQTPVAGYSRKLECIIVLDIGRV